MVNVKAPFVIYKGVCPAVARDNVLYASSKSDLLEVPFKYSISSLTLAMFVLGQ